jgi:hypothetical protein
MLNRMNESLQVEFDFLGQITCQAGLIIELGAHCAPVTTHREVRDRGSPSSFGLGGG